MSTKTDTLNDIRESITKSLTEIVSLKQTCKLHEGSIADLNKKNNELVLNLNKAEDEASKLNEEVTGLNKELNSHEELAKKLEGENKSLSATIKELEENKVKQMN